MRNFLLPAILVCLVLAACGGPATTPTQAPTQATAITPTPAQAPAPVTTTAQPPSPSSAPTITSVATAPTAVPIDTSGIDAAALFQQNCAPCHGLQRQGVVGPSLTAAALQSRGRTDQYIRDAITNGRGGMPVWGGKLTAAQIEALVQFLQR